VAYTAQPKGHETAKVVLKIAPFLAFKKEEYYYLMTVEGRKL
jgi:hypothetical protein